MKTELLHKIENRILELQPDFRDDASIKRIFAEELKLLSPKFVVSVQRKYKLYFCDALLHPNELTAIALYPDHPDVIKFATVEDAHKFRESQAVMKLSLVWKR